MNEVKERPILMSSPMVKAILEDRKSVTRRIAKFPSWVSEFTPPVGKWFEGHGDHPVGPCEAKKCAHLSGDSPWPSIYSLQCPHGVVGDRLWVRETWRAYSEKDTGYCAVKYAAGGDMEITSDVEIKNPPLPTDHWRPSIFMPRWASRITLEITGVRVERLQEISGEDAIAEGLIKLPATGKFVIAKGAQYFGAASFNPVEVYQWLWEKINGEGSWAENPFVWCVSFRRVND